MGSTSEERGQALVEAAMTLLMLLIFIFGIAETGRVLHVQQLLTDAAREGARLSVAPMTGTSNLASQNDVKNEVEKFLLSGSVDPNDTTISIDQAVTFPPNATQFTQVTVTLPYQLMTLEMFTSLKITLSGSSLMRNEISP